MAYNPERIVNIGELEKRGKTVRFGIKEKDRSRHIYVIGQTGTGKSTLLEMLAMQDIRNGTGLIFMDPHGQSVEALLNYVTLDHLDKIIYFAPHHQERPIGLNIMEDIGYDKRHLVVSSLMASFEKIWGAGTWSDRMAYILQNTLLALIEYPGTTLLDVGRMYTSKDFREKVVANLKDPQVRKYWVEEFENYTERYAQEATPSIQNKLGQFTSNPLMRNIIGQKESAFDFREIMDEGKILLVNLSKGQIGENNARMLGVLFTTKIYLSALSRSDMSKAELEAANPCNFFVDEFQSFANSSFSDILSEARKYKLNLVMAHQYLGQLYTDDTGGGDAIRDAVFGNVGTFISFRVGPVDAEIISKQFAPEIMEEDLVALPRYHIYLTLNIDGAGSTPFSARTFYEPAPEEESLEEEVVRRTMNTYGVDRVIIEKMVEDNLAEDEQANEAAKKSGGQKGGGQQGWRKKPGGASGQRGGQKSGQNETHTPLKGLLQQAMQRTEKNPEKKQGEKQEEKKLQKQVTHSDAEEEKQEARESQTQIVESNTTEKVVNKQTNRSADTSNTNDKGEEKGQIEGKKQDGGEGKSVFGKLFARKKVEQKEAPENRVSGEVSENTIPESAEENETTAEAKEGVSAEEKIPKSESEPKPEKKQENSTTANVEEKQKLRQEERRRPDKQEYSKPTRVSRETRESRVSRTDRTNRTDRQQKDRPHQKREGQQERPPKSNTQERTQDNRNERQHRQRPNNRDTRQKRSGTVQGGSQRNSRDTTRHRNTREGTMRDAIQGAKHSAVQDKRSTPQNKSRENHSTRRNDRQQDVEQQSRPKRERREERPKRQERVSTPRRERKEIQNNTPQQAKQPQPVTLMRRPEGILSGTVSRSMATQPAGEQADKQLNKTRKQQSAPQKQSKQQQNTPQRQSSQQQTSQQQTSSTGGGLGDLVHSAKASGLQKDLKVPSKTQKPAPPIRYDEGWVAIGDLSKG